MQHFWVILLYFTWIGTDEEVSGKQFYSKGLEPRITYGHRAELGQFPWQASLLISISNGSTYRCGGSLINKQWILTAAHCLYNYQLDAIFLGSTYYYENEYREDRYRRKYLASTSYLHPEYDNLTHVNDIALIKLQTRVKFNNMIQPITLANKALDPGSQVVASGWGKTHEGKHSDDLLFAHMTTLSTEKCKSSPNVWRPKTICTKGVHHENICNGDSGGPLIFCDDYPYCRIRKYVYDDSNDSDYSDYSDDSDDIDDSDGTGPFLVGITSYRAKFAKCESGYPQYFTDVYEFIDWISNTIEDDSSIKIFVNGH